MNFKNFEIFEDPNDVNNRQLQINNAIKILSSINFLTIEQESKSTIRDLIKNYCLFSVHGFYEASEYLTVKSRLNTLRERFDTIFNSQFLKDQELQKILASTKQACTANIQTEKDHLFSIISGRLNLFIHYLIVCKARGQSSIYNSLEFMKANVKTDHYDLKLIQYSEGQEEELKEIMNLRYDFYNDDISLHNTMNFYAMNHKNVSLELPQEMHLMIALMFGGRDIQKVKAIYHRFAKKEISLATPFVAGLRSKSFKNLASCFIIKMNDSVSKICDAIKNIAQISKNGGGVGVNISSIRSKGGQVKNREKASSGIIPVAIIINSLTGWVNQSGRRKAAITVSLDVWHLETLDFLDLKTEHGDPRLKARDIFPQIILNDVFMSYCEDSLQGLTMPDWYFFNPREITDKLNIVLEDLHGLQFKQAYLKCVEHRDILEHNSMKAIDLLKIILKTQIATGGPYIFFKDTANMMNPLKDEGLIYGVNLCVESFTNHGYNKRTGKDLVHTCNLASLNLGRLLSFHEIDEAAMQGIQLLDAGIDLGTPPIQGGVLHNNYYRTVGLGLMGLADHLAYHKLIYDSPQAIEYCSKLSQRLLFFSLKSSMLLAKKTEPFPAFKYSEWAKGLVLNKTVDELVTTSKNSDLQSLWPGLVADIQKYGLRNAQLLCIAPNTRTSLYHSASSSMLPVYDRFFIESNSKGLKYNFNKFSLTKSQYYTPYRLVPSKAIIDIVSALQENIDQGISFEPLYDNNDKSLTAKIRAQNIIYAWKKKIKTIYYVRSIQVTAEVSCESCAN